MDSLIAVNNDLYSYTEYDDHLKMHKVSIVDIDEDGLLTATGITHYISEEDMQNNRSIMLTMKQWVGLVTQFLTSFLRPMRA